MKQRTFWKFILIIILFLLPLLGLFHAGLPITHDGQDHVARIANFYQSLSEGNIVPRWAGNLNWGYGHPILMFLYPFPSYVASIFHFIGFSFVDSTKLVFGLSYVLSAFFMYLWVKNMWGSSAGFVAAVAYAFAPYRFVDIYVRGAVGEHVALVFSPLIFYGLFKLAGNKDKTKLFGIILALGMTGLILAHNAVSIMFLPLIGLYIIYLFIFEAKKKGQFMALSLWFIALGFLLSAFFWLPAYVEGKYTLRDIVTQGGIKDRFVPWTWFLYSPWNYGGGNDFTKQLGVIGWLGIIGSMLLLFKKISLKTKWFTIGSGIIFLVSLYLMTAWSQPIWDKVSLLQKFQFPWRFLSVTIFIVSALSGLAFSYIPKKFIYLALLLTIGIAVASSYEMWKPKAYLEKPESFYAGIYDGTTDTGESSPIWSVRFMEHRPSQPAGVILGTAEITTLERRSTHHDYLVNAHTRTRLLENTLYFPGWNVWADGREVPIEFQDPTYRGLITYWLEEGKHTVRVGFTETKLRQLANGITIFGLVIIFGMSTMGLWKIK